MLWQTAQARLREVRAAGKAGSHATDEEDPFQNFQDDEQIQREARRMVGRVDPTVNLAADRYDDYSGQGDVRAAAAQVTGLAVLHAKSRAGSCGLSV